MRPSIRPIVREMTIDVTPTMRAIWLPLITRLRMSRPRLSVPRIWVRPGSVKRAATLILKGS
jgi:hypothetical protein